MTARFLIPKETEVRHILGSLYGSDTEVTARDDAAIDFTDACLAIGIYLADDGSFGAACACNSELSAYASSALSLIPQSAAQQALKDKELSSMMKSNLHEVMNILSRLLMSSKTPHLKLKQLCFVDDLSANTKDILASRLNSAAFEIALPGYGSGRLCFMVS